MNLGYGFKIRNSGLLDIPIIGNAILGISLEDFIFLHFSDFKSYRLIIELSEFYIHRYPLRRSMTVS